MIIRGTFLESSLDPGWIHFISATILREISGDSPKIFTFPLGKDVLNNTNSKPEAGFPHMAVESVGKHIEGIQKDDDIIILSGLMWNKQHWGKISDASLTWKLTPGLEVGPISNQFVQCAFPLPLLEATQREQTGRLGPWDVPSTSNLDIGCRINANQNQQPFTTHTKLIWLALSEGQSTLQFLAISCRRIFTGNGACCWSNSKFLWSLFLSYVFSQLQTAGGDSRGWFSRWYGTTFLPWMDWGILESDQVVHLIQGIFL